MAPFELVLSRPPETLSLENIPTTGGGADPTSTLSDKRRFLKRLEDLVTTARAKLTKTQARYKKFFDARVRPLNGEVQPGDKVFLRVETRTKGRSKKLEPKEHGPFEVISNDGHTLLVRNGIEHLRVSAEGVVAAPKGTPQGESGHPETREERVAPDALERDVAAREVTSQTLSRRALEHPQTQMREVTFDTPEGSQPGQESTPRATQQGTAQLPERGARREEGERQPQESEAAENPEVEQPLGTRRSYHAPARERMTTAHTHWGPEDRYREYLERNYTIDHIAQERIEELGNSYFRVRWYGYDKPDDTWEREEDVPRGMVARFRRRKSRNVTFGPREPSPQGYPTGIPEEDQLAQGR